MAELRPGPAKIEVHPLFTIGNDGLIYLTVKIDGYYRTFTAKQ